MEQNAPEHYVPNVIADVKAHQDYAFVRLIARVPGSFSKCLSFPHPFSLSASAYIYLFI